MKIIGISGTNGSGKDSLGQMLQQNHGWLFVPATDILRDELKKRGKRIERMA
jgi:cytidylate kinase